MGQEAFAPEIEEELMRGERTQVDEIQRAEAETPRRGDEQQCDNFARVFCADGGEEKGEAESAQHEQRGMREPDGKRACEDKGRGISQPCFNANAANVRIPYGYDVTRIFS